jgi:hypothetical protein
MTTTTTQLLRHSRHNHPHSPTKAHSSYKTVSNPHTWKFPTCFSDKSPSSGTQHKGIQNQHAQFTHIMLTINTGSRKDKNVGTTENGMAARSWIKFTYVPLFISCFYIWMAINCRNVYETSCVCMIFYFK